VAAQRRTAADESGTDGYDQFNMHVAWHHVAGRQAWDIFVRGTNLTDELARVHTSFLKDVSPLPGRNLTAGVRWAF
jgi:iron complex outermembrane receptor protein